MQQELKNQEMKKKNLIKDFNQIFNLKSEDNETISETERVGYMDCSNVCMIIPKRPQFKAFLLNTFDVTEQKVPELNYVSDNVGEISSCRFSCEYLKILLTVCKYDDSVKLSVKKDYPLTAETEDFVFILAPRVENDN